MQRFSVHVEKMTKVLNLNLFVKLNFQNLKFQHRLTASNLNSFFSEMQKISTFYNTVRLLDIKD